MKNTPGKLMPEINVLLTGVTSFSGSHFAFELLKSGHNVVGFTRNKSSWNKEQNDRISWIKKQFPKFEILSSAETSKLRSAKIGTLCFHGANCENYQSLDFNVEVAITEYFEIANHLLSIYPNANVFHTGTFSEPNESTGNLPRRSFNPYSTSKTKIWQILNETTQNIKIAKYVMPNPFGPLESRRFTDYLIRSWALNQEAIIKFPFYVRDYVPIDLLRKHYVKSLEIFEKNNVRVRRFYPSMYAETNEAFAYRYKRELELRTTLSPKLKSDLNSKHAEPIIRINSENCRLIVDSWTEEESWNLIVENAIERMRLHNAS
jgi:hypothetical protein